MGYVMDHEGTQTKFLTHKYFHRKHHAPLGTTKQTWSLTCAIGGVHCIWKTMCIIVACKNQRKKHWIIKKLWVAIKLSYIHNKMHEDPKETQRSKGNK